MAEVWYWVLPSLQEYKVVYPETQKDLDGLLTLSLGKEFTCPSPSPMLQNL